MNIFFGSAKLIRGSMMPPQDLNTANKTEEILPLDIDHLPESFKQKAVKELNYSPETAENALKELKQLIANDDVLDELQFIDSLLNIYLTCRKFSVNRAFKRLKDGIKFRKKQPEVFFVPTYDVLSPFIDEGMITALPKRCQDGCAIIYINSGKWSAEKHPLEAMKQFVNFVILQCLRKPMTQVNGFKLIIDLDLPLDFLKICTPNIMRVIAQGIFVVCPGRFKAVHFLNMYGIGRMLWQMAKMIFPAKLRERVQIHTTTDTLLDFFDREVLPCHLGGDMKDYDMTWWLKKYLTPEERSATEFKIFETL